MTMESLRLPPEIIGEIVSFVSDDRETLLSCALVCQDWMSESRALLFQDIHIYSQKMLLSFVTNVLRSERLHPWLASTHDIWIASFVYTDEGEPEAFMLEISEHLPNLRTMWLTSFPRHRGVNQKAPRVALRTDLFPALGQFASLNQLDLSECGFASFGDFKSVLVALLALSSLSMFQVSWPDSGDPDQSSALAAPHTRPALSHLSVDESTGDILYDWLSNTPTRSTLRELTLHVDNLVAGSHMVADASLTALTITKMEETHIDVYADPQFAQIPKLFSGTENIELLRLHDDFDYHMSSWDRVVRVLRLFASTGSVRVLRLCCSPHHFDEYDGEKFHTGLEKLDPILKDGAFSSLEVVQFASFLALQEKELQKKHDQFSALLQHKLPRLHERVAVEFACWKVIGP